MNKTIKTNKQIKSYITKIANSLNKDYSDKEPIILALLNDSYIFLLELIKKLDFSFSVDFITLKTATYCKTPLKDLVNKDIILVTTFLKPSNEFKITHLRNIFNLINVKSLKIVSLANYKDLKETTDYNGFITDYSNLYGFGIQKDNKTTNLDELVIEVEE